MTTLILPDHLSSTVAAVPTTPQAPSILNDAYVKAEDRVLDPTKIPDTVLARLPQPTGWRLLILPYRGKSKIGSVYVPDEYVAAQSLATVVAYVLVVGPDAYSDLHFGYPGAAHAALAGVGFNLPVGQTLGLVGPTGAGKSTLLKLLLRQWPAAAGEVRWGGTALPDFTLAALRAGMAWVPQEPFLFSATVAENIALARPGASRAEIEAAARSAAVHADITALPQGYDTPVGERGITLSGGQRQRVAIARALLADAPLLLLDDALSAVDTGTASQILQALRQQRAGRTVVIVSHRLATVMDADQILVLRHGRVAERGTHAALLTAALTDGHAGWYATQWQVQQLEASLESDEVQP